MRVAVSDQYAFEFAPHAYAPAATTTGALASSFRKHFYRRMGDFDSKEEFECACQLDMWAQQGRIQFWVRNLVRRGFARSFCKGRWAFLSRLCLPTAQWRGAGG